MRKYIFPLALTAFLVTAATLLKAQESKPALTHDVYDKWQSVAELSAPGEGSIVFYVVKPQEGDRTLFISNPFTGGEWSIERGCYQQVDKSSTKVVAQVKPLFQQTRQAKIKKKKSDQMPTDTLVVLDLKSGERKTYPNVKSFKTPARLDQWLAFTTKPAVKSDAKKTSKDSTVAGIKRDSLKSETKIGKPAKADEPEKDNLYLLNINTNRIDTIAHVEKYAFSKDGKWLAYTRKFIAAKKKPADKKKGAKDSLAAPKADTSATPSGLYLYDLAKSVEIKVIEGGKKNSFELPKFSAKGKIAFYGCDSTVVSVYVYDIAKGAVASTITSENIAKDVRYYAPIEGEKSVEYKEKANAIARGEAQQSIRFDARRVVISKNASLMWNAGGDKLFFGVAPQPREKDTTIVDFERARLDIWAWDAEYIPTIQLNRSDRIAKTTFSCYAELDAAGAMERFVQLGDVEVPNVVPGAMGEAKKLLIGNGKPYVIQSQWDYDRAQDFYYVDVESGVRTLCMSNVLRSGVTSPDGEYELIYDDASGNYSMLRLSDGKMWNLTDQLQALFYTKGHDTPNLPGQVDRPVWFENSKAALIADQNDVWMVSVDPAVKPVCITSGYGKANNMTFRVTNMSSDERYMLNADIVPVVGRLTGKSPYLQSNSPISLVSFNEVTKQNGLYSVAVPDAYWQNALSAKVGRKESAAVAFKAPVKIVDAPKSFGATCLASDGKRGKLFFTMGDFQHPMDLWRADASVSSPRSSGAAQILVPSSLSIWPAENWRVITSSPKQIETANQITIINHWQSEFNWGSVELIHWTTLDGIKADGLLYKPENFDPAKKYPVIFYFYEKYSETLYNYRSPAPSRSTVNVPFFVSNGYIVCIPDIYYNVGTPGKSCMRTLMPCVDMLEQYPWVDSANMAIQGQSWGGYQVAYIITQTDRFKAAGAGAPVSNMTSAYSGIRWGSGVTRQAQYEDGQSRIGYNLWDGLNLYMDNSPLFGLPKVKTPVLIMHNDKDGAVPWWQGIEMFNGLRRLGKPAWMLQYNDEDHNLVERRNAKDLSIRLEQFFNHFLKGAPMPSWMKYGRPVVDKEYDLGYEME